MKAAILENWQHIQVQAVDAPAVEAGEVLIRVERAGICGSDVHIYNGDNPIATTPVIQGHEFMGFVDTLGEGVSGLNPGQRVVIQPLIFCGNCTPCRRGIPHVCEKLTVVGVNRNGAFAEYVSVPHDTLFGLPDDLPDNVAVLAEPFSIGFHACQRGSIRPTDRVLIIGGGPIGFYSALTARELGAEQITLSEPLKERRNLISNFALEVVDPLSPSTLTKLQEQTNFEGYDLVIETSGTTQGLDFASQASAVDGRIVTLGFPAKNYADYNITRGIVRELTLIGSRVCTRAQFAQTLELLTQLHRGDQYDLTRLVTAPRGLADLSRSIADVDSGAECAKILITPEKSRVSRTLFVLQGGGPTSVINATLAGIAEHGAGQFDQLLGLRHSFESLTENKLCDLSNLLQGEAVASRLKLLADTPGALLGSSRKKVDEPTLQNLLNTLREHSAIDLIGIGGNGTMSVLNTLSEFAACEGYPLNIIGAPKTVDNDLVGVHAAPGYGSAARYVALAVRDYDRDFKAMSTFDDVTILETMGRNCGWIAAASSLLKQSEADAPHILLLPEQPFDEAHFLDYVADCHARYGRVFIVTNEMLSDSNGSIVGEAVQNGPRDGLGRAMYSLSTGTGNFLAELIWTRLGLQTRCLRPGSLGRAASYCQSEPDRDLALDAGREAVSRLLAGEANQHMITVDEQLQLATQRLAQCAGEKPLPNEFINRESPYQVTHAFMEFARPLIGEIEPLFDDKL